MLYPQYFIDDLKNRADIVRIITVFALLLVLTVESFGQEKPAAILVDEFGKITCENLLARADNLGMQLRSNPLMAGIVEVSGSDNKFADYEIVYLHRALIGRFGVNINVKIFRVESKGAPLTRFWLTPNNADAPFQDGKLIASIPFTISHRFYFGGQTMSPCDNYLAYGFAEVIRSDPRYRGQIVDFNVPTRERVSTATHWANFIKNDLKLDRRRVRIYFKNSDNRDYRFGHTEFWIFPEVKNNALSPILH